jgi:serine/threonine-protein kinase
MSDNVDAGCDELHDRYELIRRLGKGGMADVFLAKRVTDGMLVAIKVLRPEFTRTMGREMFHREIALLKSLDHPNILPLLESGEQRERLCFISPYAEGGSLADRFNEGEYLAPDAAVPLARQLAAALDYAHQHNVVHRDIKPGNVLFMQDRAVLCDFGVARAIIRSGGERLSSSGLLVGTPHYMSPEQASGASKLDGKSDVYSLACVVYEALMVGRSRATETSRCQPTITARSEARSPRTRGDCGSRGTREKSQRPTKDGQRVRGHVGRKSLSEARTWPRLRPL